MAPITCQDFLKAPWGPVSQGRSSCLLPQAWAACPPTCPRAPILGAVWLSTPTGHGTLAVCTGPPLTCSRRSGLRLAPCHRQGGPCGHSRPEGTPGDGPGEQGQEAKEELLLCGHPATSPPPHAQLCLPWRRPVEQPAQLGVCLRASGTPARLRDILTRAHLAASPGQGRLVAQNGKSWALFWGPSPATCLLHPLEIQIAQRPSIWARFAAPRRRSAKAGGTVVATTGRGRCSGIWWVRAGEAARYPTGHRMPCSKTGIPPYRPVVPKLRKPGLAGSSPV